MKSSKLPLLITAAVLLILTMWGVGQFNGMVEKSEGVDSQWGNVENAYQRRADLIPNLVSTVKGYADFEKETLTAVIEARSKASSMQIDASNLTADNMASFQAAQGKLSSALSRLLVTVERYPDLKANQNFLALQSQLEGTENRINTERNRFNKAARSYNSHIKKFPARMLASMGGFESRPYFESSAGSETVPQVAF